MLKKFSGQELFIIIAAISVLLFMYMTIIMTGESLADYENKNSEQISSNSIQMNGDRTEKRMTNEKAIVLLNQKVDVDEDYE